MRQRSAALIASIIAVGIGWPAPSFAADPVAVGNGQTVLVYVPGSSGSNGIPSTGDAPTSGSGSTAPIVCSYYWESSDAPGDVFQGDPSDFETGDWVWASCYDPGTGSAVGPPVLFQWNMGLPPPLQPSAGDLAQVALGRLAVPLPAVQTWPASGGTSLVNVPVWLHVGNWAQLTASASAGGLTATITARPIRAAWETGEDTIVCDSPGSTFEPGVLAGAQVTSCSYSYRHSSGTQDDGTFHGTSTLVWHLQWNATNGQGGDLGEISRTSAFALRVEESQAVVVPAR